MVLLLAGPLALARKHLEEDKEPFFVLNSDVICSYPFNELLEFHKAHGKEGTIIVSYIYCIVGKFGECSNFVNW